MKLAALILSATVLSACQSVVKPAVTPTVEPTESTRPSEQPEPQPQPQPQPQPALSVTEATLLGNFEHPDLTEISGLAVSTADGQTLWTINDSGNAGYLYANKINGQFIRRWRVNARNRDWEDLASIAIDGQPYLLIADIGDNLQVKAENDIVVISEPALTLDSATKLDPITTIRFRYPDGAHNAESLAVSDNWIYILTKERLLADKRQASQIYRVPLVVADTGISYVAELIGSLNLPPLTLEGKLAAALTGYDLFQPTGFDIDINNRDAYFVSYRGVHRLTRNANESWGAALSKPSVKIHSHKLKQAEAIAVTNNGTVLFTSEKRAAPIWAFPPNTALINN